MIAENPDEVIFAAPPEGGYSDWWVTRFTLTEGVWKPRETELVDQHQTPAQLGRGLSLAWGETTVLDDGAWGSTLQLTNGRGASWSSGKGYELWGVAHAFDPETGGEIGHAARSVGSWGVESVLASGESVRLPLSLGGALSALGSGHEYDVVACVPELGLGSPVGTLRVAGHPMASATVLTYVFDGASMEGAGRRPTRDPQRMSRRRGSVSQTDLRPVAGRVRDGVPTAGNPVPHRRGGREVARLGDEVTLVGEYVPLESVDEATIGGIPDTCRTPGEGYFLTSGLAED